MPDPVVSLVWRKSSFSGADACLELAKSQQGDVLMRNSKDPAGSIVRLTEAEMHAFVAGVKAGEFDDL